VAADGVEERVQRADEFRVVGLACQFVLQDCKVALEQVPVDLPRSLDRDLGCGQELPEPGDRADALVNGVGPAARRGTPASPSFGQRLQPRLRDLAEADRGLLAGDTQVTQPPQVTRVFGIPPAAALAQVLDVTAGRDQQRPRMVSPARQLSRPLRLTEVQDRDGAAGRQDGDRTPGGARMSLALTMVPAALQGVLHLKLQLPSQLPQVDLPLARAGPVRVHRPGRGHVVVQVRLAVVMPPRVVGVAQPAGLHRPAATAGPAPVPAEDRVIESEGKLISAELGPDRGQELFQQAGGHRELPRGTGRRAGGAAHWSSSPSKTVAVSRTFT